MNRTILQIVGLVVVANARSGLAGAEGTRHRQNCVSHQSIKASLFLLARCAMQLCVQGKTYLRLRNTCALERGYSKISVLLWM